MKRLAAIWTLLKLNGRMELIPWVLAHLTGRAKYAQEAEEALVAFIPKATEAEDIRGMFNVLRLRLDSLGYDGKERCLQIRRKIMWESQK